MDYEIKSEVVFQDDYYRFNKYWSTEPGTFPYYNIVCMGKSADESVTLHIESDDEYNHHIPFVAHKITTKDWDCTRTFLDWTDDYFEVLFHAKKFALRVEKYLRQNGLWK